MTGAPIHFDRPPMTCPGCMHSQWREVTAVAHDFDDSILHYGTGRFVCAVCHPDPAKEPKVYVQGEDPTPQGDAWA